MVTRSSARPQATQSDDSLLAQIQRVRRGLWSRGADADSELREGLERLEMLARFEAMRDEIEAAGQKLEAHRDAFEEMMADPPAALERAVRLFAEEPFVHLRYDADDLERAFEAVGYPMLGGEDPVEEEMEKVVAATLYLAGDTESRVALAQQLLMTMPEYVDAGRYFDGWLIQHSAYLMIESAERSSPFLFAMFDLAHDEWARRAEEEHEALIRELGIDPSALRGSSPEEMDAMMQELAADPRLKARLEAFYDDHPKLRDQATEELMALEQAALQLLEREDGEHLLLSPEEVAPWLLALMERLASAEAQFREAMQRGEGPDAETVREMETQLGEVTQEMASEVFTPERVARLVSDLQSYRRRLMEAGERGPAAAVHGALMSIQGDVPPADDHFLLGLCYMSLRRVLAGAATRGRDQ
jgi:hypothetical protein